MQKAPIILFIAGGLVAIGWIVTAYGAYLVEQGVTKEKTILNGTNIEITKEFDPSVKTTGIFHVTVENFEGDDLVMKIFDPMHQQITLKIINQTVTEEKFEIDTKGTYRLVLENSESNGKSTTVGLTYTPDDIVYALNIGGLYTMISGFVLVLISVIIYVIERMKKAQLR